MPPNSADADLETFSFPPLEQYDISPETGFLPPAPPLRRLPNPYYEPWESLIDNYHDLMLSGRLRTCIRKLDALGTDRLTTPAEYRRAFLVLSILAHGYVRGHYEPACDTLPASMAVPWVQVSKILGIAPIVNHAAVVLWNWRLIFPDEPISLNNLATLITYSNTLDESWFYLVTTAIEAEGGRAVTAIISAIEAAHNADNEQLLAALRVIRSVIEDLLATLQRMYEKCDPYVFYRKVRPYLSGWENEDQLPKGLVYEGVDENGEDETPVYRQYVGASAGQSALIQALDIALGVEHYPTGVKPQTSKSPADAHSRPYHALHLLNPRISPSEGSLGVKPQQPYLHKIRQNIPGSHRQFLEDLTKVADIRGYITSQAPYDPNDAADQQVLDVVGAYNDCLKALKTFRDKHLQIVTFYIVQQARRVGGSHLVPRETAQEIKVPASQPTTSAASVTRDDLQSERKDESVTPTTKTTTKATTTTTTRMTTVRSVAGNEVIKGTGGTDLVPFLKQMRDETAAKEIIDLD